jgi:hypothetical protein
MLKAIGETLGIKIKPSAGKPMPQVREKVQEKVREKWQPPTAPPEMSPGEQAVVAGFRGDQNVTKYDDLPITVRELIVQVQKGKFGKA